MKRQALIAFNKAKNVVADTQQQVNDAQILITASSSRLHHHSFGDPASGTQLRGLSRIRGTRKTLQHA